MKLLRLVWRSSAARASTAFWAGRNRSWTLVVFPEADAFGLGLRMVGLAPSLLGIPLSCTHNVNTPRQGSQGPAPPATCGSEDLAEDVGAGLIHLRQRAIGEKHVEDLGAVGAEGHTGRLGAEAQEVGAAGIVLRERAVGRSEERRVGKEGRDRRWR